VSAIGPRADSALRAGRRARSRPSRAGLLESCPSGARFARVHAAPRPRQTRSRLGRDGTETANAARGLSLAPPAQRLNPPSRRLRPRDRAIGPQTRCGLVSRKHRATRPGFSCESDGAVSRLRRSSTCSCDGHAAPRRRQTRFQRRGAPAAGTRRTETATAAAALACAAGGAVDSVVFRRAVPRLGPAEREWRYR